MLLMLNTEYSGFGVTPCLLMHWSCCSLTLSHGRHIPEIIFGKLLQLEALWPVSIKRCRLTIVGIPIIKMRWSHNHSILIKGMPIPRKTVFILRQAPGQYLGCWCKAVQRARASAARVMTQLSCDLEISDHVQLYISNCINSLNCNFADCWNALLKVTRSCSSFTVHTMAPHALAPQGARASSSIVSTDLLWNVSVCSSIRSSIFVYSTHTSMTKIGCHYLMWHFAVCLAPSHYLEPGCLKSMCYGWTMTPYCW